MQRDSKAVHYLTISVGLMLEPIAAKGFGRSGCSLFVFAVDCQLLISHNAMSSSVFIEANLMTPMSQFGRWQPTPQPSVCSPSLFSLPLGVCWDAPSAQQLAVPASRPRGWGGANQSQLGAFHLLFVHLKSASQQGCVVPSLHQPLATLYSPNGGTGPP